MIDQKLVDLLKKRAEGFFVTEVAEEFAVNNGEEALVRKKVASKFIPPELSALKLLIEFESDKHQDDLDSLSYEELLEEKNKLIAILQEL